MLHDVYTKRSRTVNECIGRVQPAHALLRMVSSPIGFTEGEKKAHSASQPRTSSKTPADASFKISKAGVSRGIPRGDRSLLLDAAKTQQCVVLRGYGCA